MNHALKAKNLNFKPCLEVFFLKNNHLDLRGYEVINRIHKNRSRTLIPLKIQVSSFECTTWAMPRFMFVTRVSFPFGS